MERLKMILYEQMFHYLEASAGNVTAEFVLVPLSYVRDIRRRPKGLFAAHTISFRRRHNDLGFIRGVGSDVGKQLIGIGKMLDHIGAYDEVEGPFYLGAFVLDVVFNPFAHSMVLLTPAYAVCLIDPDDSGANRVYVLYQLYAISAADIKDAFDRMVLGNPSSVSVNGNLENAGEIFAVLMWMSGSI